MDARDTLFDWTGAELMAHEAGEATETELLVADSFLVRDGTALALGLHRSRFTESARLQGQRDPSELERAWTAGIAAIPRDGAWFPRFELVRARDALRLRFRLRSAPQPGADLVVATAASDPRQAPDIKGPDIDRLAVLRQRAHQRGAQEAVILDEGLVADGSTTALLWWRGDTLFAPPLSLPRVDSVAARTVRGIAAALGIPVDEEEARPAQLDGVSLWAVNALHGIRPVTSWIDGPALAHDTARLEAWRARFSALLRPLPPLP